MAWLRTRNPNVDLADPVVNIRAKLQATVLCEIGDEACCELSRRSPKAH